MIRFLRIGAVAFVATFAVTAAAQATEWRVTPYAWIAGFDGTVGLATNAPGAGGRVDIDTGGLSDSIDLSGAMLHVNWRSGRWTAFGDWTYASVKSDAPTPFATLYSGVDVKVRGNVAEAMGGYELLNTPGTTLDLFGGVRYYNLRVEVGLREGLLPGTLARNDEDWVDGVVGLRWQTRFADHWEAFASADVGGGGSDLAWQLYGGIGYRFSWGSLVVGWRHLHVDYKNGASRLDAAFTGPLIGASFFF